MNKLAKFISQHKKGIIAAFVALSLIGAVFFLCTPINYNMMDYLPAEANSTLALDEMEAEFDQPIPNLNIMVEDVSLTEALEIKEKIAASDHVIEVLWLDDSVDLKTPIEMEDTVAVETYYKDGYALFMATAENGNERAAIASIRENIGTCKISGTAADQASAQEMAVSEAVRSIILLIPVLIIILVLATESWIEPIFYLLTLGVAVLINLGTNYFLGRISFVTLAAAPILQMAVSLDYAVFLSHSFAEHKSHGIEPTEAIRLALLTSSKSISASMLTTLFGFLALMFMKFRIGADMGISLVKGVLLSFICVMTFLPAVLLCGSSLIDKTRHKRLIPTFQGIGKGIMKIHIPVALLLLLVLVPCYLGQNNNHYFYGTSEKTEEGTEAYEIEETFGVTNTLVLLVPTGDSARENLLCEELEELPHITSVISYASMVSNKIPTAYLDDSIVEQFYSDKYARIILYADCPYEGTEAFTLVEQVRSLAESYYPEGSYACGQSANMYDMKETVQSDNSLVNLITVISIYVILAFMTRNWMVPILLILTIKCSIWLNMCIPYFTGNSLSYLGYLIVSTVQMGATVDYAILLTDTYQEKRRQAEPKQAMIETLGSIFSSILISAVTLTLSGFCLNWSSSNAVVQILGELIGRGAILAVVMVMLLLPTLLLLTDRLVPHTTLGFKRRKRSAERNTL